MKLRTVIKFTARGALALFLTVATAAPAARADSAPRGEASYYSTRGVLAEFFPKSEHVGYRTFAIDQSIRARLAQRLGYAPVRDKYTIFVATTHGKVDGYAVVDDEQGLHQPITFATRLSPRGMVERRQGQPLNDGGGDVHRHAQTHEKVHDVAVEQAAEHVLRSWRQIGAETEQRVRRNGLRRQDRGYQRETVGRARDVPVGQPGPLWTATQ